MKPRVSIIILNWNNWRDTIKCLESLDKITYPNYNVIIVDNGSQDDSLRRISSWAGSKVNIVSNPYGDNPTIDPTAYAEHKKERAKPAENRLAKKIKKDKRLTLIKNEKNYGFSGGNNIGAKYALDDFDPDYIFLLNNDTIVHAEFLSEIVKQAEQEYPSVGMLQSKIVCMDDARRLDSAGGMISHMGAGGDRGAWEIDRRLYDNDLEIFYAKGAALMIRADVAKKVGLLDPKFAIYYEDTDLGWRVWLGGYKVLYSPRSIVYHAGGSTMKKQPFARVLFSKKKNQIAMLIKNYNGLNLVKYIFLRFVNDTFRRTLLATTKMLATPFSEEWKSDRSSATLGPVLRAYLWNVANLRYLWKEHLKNQRLIRKVPDSSLPFMDKNVRKR